MVVVGESTADVLEKARELVLAKGERIDGQRGQTCSLKGVDLVLNHPFTDPDPYPFWDRNQTEWYLRFFVAKTKTNQPEKLAQPGSYLTPYRYAHRSRYYDFGFGYTLGFCRALNKLEIDPDQINGLPRLEELLIQAGQLVHVQRILSVMYWWGKNILRRWLKEQWELEEMLKRTRRDTLLDVVKQIKHSPNTRRAITPSFIYPNFDLALPAGGVPPYQNYQLFQSNLGIVSIHLHRAIDLRGGAQLDVAHDIAWGREVSSLLDQPLTRIIIRVNDLYLPTSGVLANTEDIKVWLMTQTDGYPSTPEGVEKELTKPIYGKSVKIVWRRWRG